VATLHEANLRNIVSTVLNDYPDFVAADDMSPKAGSFPVLITRVDTPREGPSGEDAMEELIEDLVGAINADDFEVIELHRADNSFKIQVTSRFRVGGSQF
jgi:hypothetical protein